MYGFGVWYMDGFGWPETEIDNKGLFIVSFKQ
jgi:hypothetical protein